MPKLNTAMQRLQAYRYELIPSSEQQRKMLGLFAGSCRFVFNKALEIQNNGRNEAEKRLGYAELLSSFLTDWRNGTDSPWSV